MAVGSVVPGGSAPVVLFNSAVPPYRGRMWFKFQKALDGSGMSWQIHLSTIKWTAGTRLLPLERGCFSSHLKGAGSLRELPVQTTCVLWTWRKWCSHLTDVLRILSLHFPRGYSLMPEQRWLAAEGDNGDHHLSKAPKQPRSWCISPVHVWGEGGLLTDWCVVLRDVDTEAACCLDNKVLVFS